MTATVTVVSAFYPIRSKFPTDQYIQWAFEFLRLEAPIVLFTEPHLASLFRSMRTNGRPLHIVETLFESLQAWVLYSEQWKKQHALDHERYHTPELYAVWAQKAWCVEETVQRNPHGTTHFFWCDIGAFRTPMTEAMRLHFPRADAFPEDKILLCSVAPLHPHDWRQKDGILGDFLYMDRIVGGLWGGSAAACLRWRSAYEAQLLQYFAAGRFAGKDQSVMLSAYLADPTLARIVKPTTAEGDRWFFLEYALSDGRPLETDASYIPPLNPPTPPILSVLLQGGLGNQLFQIAAAWAHARRTGARLRLQPTKLVSDGRPMYWDSVFHRFQHLLGPVPVMPHWWEPAATVYGQPPIPSSVGLQLRGYFQAPKYFAEYSAEIRKLFHPSVEALRYMEEKYGSLLAQKDRIVVVHARRGDYCKAADYHGPLPAAYYREAMKRFPADSIFLLVSDEPMWWIEVIGLLPALQQSTFHILMESDEIATFTLLQQFRQFIIANSSFSWWAAWLADAAHVVAPAQWFGPDGPKQWEDLYMPEWERI